MKLKSSLSVCVLAGVLAFTAAVSLCGALLLRSQAVSSEYDSQKTLSGTLYILADSFYIQKQRAADKELEKAAAPYFSVRKKARDISSKAGEPSIAPISFLGFDYFAGNSDAFQIFYSQSPFPDGDSCAKVAGVPEDMRGDLDAYLRSHDVLPERYRCFIQGGKSYFGYLLDSAAGKHVTYLYVEKFPDDRRYAPDTSKQPQLDDILRSVLRNAEIDHLYLIVRKGETVFSSLRADLSGISAELKDNPEAFSRKAELNGKEYLISGTCGKNSLCSLVGTPLSPIVKPYAIFGIAAGCAGLILLALIFLLIRKSSVAEEKDANEVSAFISTLGDQALGAAEDTDNAVKALTADQHRVPVGIRVALTEAVRKVGDSIERRTEERLSEAEKISEGKFADGVETQLAREQKALLPKPADLPSSRFLDIGSYLLPSRKGCTDCYDIFRVDKDNIALMMGSSTVKGAPALRALTETSVLIRKALAFDGLRPAEALTSINSMLISRNHDGVVLKVFVMILSEYTGNYVMCSAGVSAPYQFGLQGVRRLEFNKAHGLFENPEEVYENFKGKLDFGDTVLITGEGFRRIRDFADEKTYGDEQLGVICEEGLESEGSADVLMRINRSAGKFAGRRQPESDMAVICIKKTNNVKERV
ncbi:MAG: SpoIIE family protein phosphatase [Succinivibrio sp.]|nr:SpoIIE family protein phosphatase [Succinivibrio sp.]